MRLFLLFCLVVSLPLLGGGCSETCSDVTGIGIEADVELSSYQTFSFFNEAMIPTGSEADITIPEEVMVNLDLLNGELRRELVALGLTEIEDPEAETPDVFAFSLATAENVEGITWVCVPGSVYGYWGYAWDPCAWMEPVYYEYTEGTALVGIADPEREQVVFGGVMNGVLDSDNVQGQVANGIECIFEYWQ